MRESYSSTTAVPLALTISMLLSMLTIANHTSILRAPV